jgi:hypothetical protein
LQYDSKKSDSLYYLNNESKAYNSSRVVQANMFNINLLGASESDFSPPKAAINGFRRSDDLCNSKMAI